MKARKRLRVVNDLQDSENPQGYEEPSREYSPDEDFAAYMARSSEGDWRDNVRWAANALAFIQNDRSRIGEILNKAPNGGARMFVHMYFDSTKVFTDFLKDSFKKQDRHGGFTDDQRRRLEIFDQAYHFFSEKYLAERKCPCCQRQLGKRTVLLKRPKESA